MNEFSDSVVGVWIVFFLLLVAATLGAFWWVMRTRNMKLRSRTPANDRDQQHEEFITHGVHDLPPELEIKK